MLGAGLRPVVDVLRFRVDRNLPVVVDTTSVRGALGEAGGTRRAGAIVLVDGEGRLSGIFTDGDLRRLVNNSTDLPATLEEPISDHTNSRWLMNVVLPWAS